MTPGYLDEPEETAAILHDGWLWTGDLAERDADGFFYHRGRAKEILKIGGHRVSPIEIEQVVAAPPRRRRGGRDRRAGRPHGRGARRLRRAPLRARADREADLLRFCRERLPAYQVPVDGHVRGESLPRNESGKLLRATLAQRLVGHPPGSGPDLAPGPGGPRREGHGTH